MTIEHKVRNFPTFPITKQLFHVPGAVAEGGFTVGGARINSPEPGGFSMLEIQPALQVNEWTYPIASWLMSQTNAQILRVRLAPTPQVSIGQAIRSGGVTWDGDLLWSNQEQWQGDLIGQYAANALEGTNTVQVDLTDIGNPILQAGHVIGHKYDAYLIDEIEYNGLVATITVKPTLRRDVTAGDTFYFRPFFTGQIANGDAIREAYDAQNAGHVQIGSIILSEVILP